MTTRRPSEALEEDEYELEQADLEERGGLLHERSIFNVGFLFGLGFSIASAAVWGTIVGAAIALGVFN
jgi:hypothetical protein